jgi:methyl-accepting chemotaxis protein
MPEPSQTATDTTRAIEQTRHATHDLAATAARLTTLMSAFQH